MIKSMAIAAALLVSGPVLAQQPQTNTTTTPNIFGGWDSTTTSNTGRVISNSSSTPNIFGGWDTTVTAPGGRQIGNSSTTPNIFGGYDTITNGRTR